MMNNFTPINLKILTKLTTSFKNTAYENRPMDTNKM